LNRVILQNAARSQQVQGLVWIGELRYPLLTIVKLNPGEKPINIEGYDLLLSEDGYAAYGDKRLLRYTMDTGIDAKNRLLFFGTGPGGAEGRLAMWLARKGGDTLSNGGILQISHFIQNQSQIPAPGKANVLLGWCGQESDLFQPENKAYLVYAEPPPDVLRSILRTAQENGKATPRKKRATTTADREQLATI
jgi:hypothetical protein